jgi:adenylate kinase
MIIVTFGAPGSGKGTHSDRMAAKYSIPHISTGDLLRAKKAADPEFKAKVDNYMKGGGLVPDSIVIDLLAERISKSDCVNGFVLDGFPRTVPQKDALDEFLKSKGKKVDAVIHIDVPEDMIKTRMDARWTCTHCEPNATYSRLDDPGIDHCKKCGNELIKREDDKKETVEKRFVRYRAESVPVIPLYEKDNIYHKVSFTDIKASPDENFKKIAVVLNEVEAKLKSQKEKKKV